MQQEQDTCRICSGPGEADQPLFHPCKCSGTIRYIHQDCLKVWLEHSKKTTCDVCKHPYSFTKVYAPDMPDRVPITVLVRKFTEQFIHAILFMLRALLVAVVWLTVLPYATLLTWRMYFRFGNTVASLVSLHPVHQRFTPPLPRFPLPSHPDNIRGVNIGNITAFVELNEKFREGLIDSYLRSLPGDIFSGQIIASLIVLAFLAAFLLREWIMQNARPGIFDDAPPPPVDVGVQAGPPQPQGQPQPQPQVQRQAQAQPQVQRQPQPPPQARPPQAQRPAQVQPQPQVQRQPPGQPQPQPQARPPPQVQRPAQAQPQPQAQRQLQGQPQPPPQARPPPQIQRQLQGQPQPQPQARPPPQVQRQPQGHPQSQPQVQPPPQIQSQLQLVQGQPQPQPQARPPPQVQRQAQAPLQPQVQRQPQGQPQPQPQARPPPQVQRPPQTQPQPQVQRHPQAQQIQRQPQTQPQLQPQPPSQARPPSQLQSSNQAGPQPQAQVQPQARQQPQAQSQAQAQFQARPQPQPQILRHPLIPGPPALAQDLVRPNPQPQPPARSQSQVQIPSQSPISGQLPAAQNPVRPQSQPQPQSQSQAAQIPPEFQFLFQQPRLRDPEIQAQGPQPQPQTQPQSQAGQAPQFPPQYIPLLQQLIPQDLQRPQGSQIQAQGPSQQSQAQLQSQALQRAVERFQQQPLQGPQQIPSPQHRPQVGSQPTESVGSSSAAQVVKSESSLHSAIGPHVPSVLKTIENGEVVSSSSDTEGPPRNINIWRERRFGRLDKRMNGPIYSLRPRASDPHPDPAGRLPFGWQKAARRRTGSSSSHVPNGTLTHPEVPHEQEGSKGKRKATDADLEDRWSQAHGQEVSSNAFRHTFLPDDNFKFTFQTPGDINTTSGPRTSPNEPNKHPNVGGSTSPPIMTSHSTIPAKISTALGKNEKSREELQYPVTPQSSAGSNESSSEEEFAKAGTSLMKQNGTANLPSGPRRPPLAASVSRSEQPNVDVPSSVARIVNDPLPSPSLATYKAPEELVLEDAGYFDPSRTLQTEERDENDADDEEDDDDEGRLTDYFVEPKAPVEGGQAQGMRDSDDEEDEEDVPDIEQRREHPADDAQENPPAPGADAVAQEADDEDREQILDEDLDGAMEAVGLRGPLSAILQNASLMLIILNMAIGVGIWLPFTLGKTIALLTLEPRRALQILHWPIRAVRLLTDPTVDFVIYCMRFITLSIMDRFKSVLPRVDILNWCRSMLPPLDTISIMGWCKSVFPSFRTAKSSARVTGSANWVSNVLKFIFTDQTIPFFKLSPVIPVAPAPSPWPFQIVSSIWSFVGLSSKAPKPASQGLPEMIQHFEAIFAKLGKNVRVNVMAAFKQWAAMVENDGNAERVWAVVLGYGTVAFLAALYLNTFTLGNMRSARRAVRNAIRQQMIVTKVALFIVVELVLFPFGCGIMLDYSTLPLFPEASVGIRLAFFARAPITACFYHWLLGTMFMYQFAILLATCRELLRPGCMWFIKDPQDPAFHPIRDILDRPTFAQLRKLGLSAIMYGIIIFLGVGMVISGLDTLLPSVFPLRWKMRDPLSEIPVDLLFIHLILPPTLHYFRPKKPIRKLMTMWWRWTAHQLRLTSYMFGDRNEAEEFTPNRTWLYWLSKNINPTEPPAPCADGGFCRVPAGDNIAFLRDRPAMIRVDEKGEAMTQRGREIMEAQDAEARQAGRNPVEDYKVVYIPPHFIKRVIVFITSFWLAGSLALFTVVAVPTVAGRAVFRLFATREFHDGYSFIIGFYLIWWSWLVGSLFVKVRIRRQRHASIREIPDGDKKGRVRASWLLFLFKRVTVYFSKILWLVFWLGFVIPTLLSIALDVYLIIPIRALLNPGFTPTIHLWQSWATGLLLAGMIMKAHTNTGMHLDGGLDAIRRNGWRRPDPWGATNDFIVPAVAGLFGLITMPPLCVYAVSKVFVLPMGIEQINRLVYPAIFVVIAIVESATNLAGVFNKWTQNIRDKEFLVELRLRNLEQSPNKDKAEAPVVGAKE